MVTKLATVLADPRFSGPSDEEIAHWEAQEIEAKRLSEARLRRAQRATNIESFRCTDAMREALVDGRITDTDAVTVAQTWLVERDKPWLVLSGPTGCGKSLAAASVAANHRAGTFVRADELVRLFSSMFGEQYERQQGLRDAQLLVVDDLGCEYDAGRMLPALLDLLDARQSAKRHPTIVTTNLTPQAFRERYPNDRLHSRMAELVRWEGVLSEDMRRKK